MAEDRPAWLGEIEGLRRDLEALEARLGRLECGSVPPPTPGGEVTAEPAADPTSEVVLRGLRRAPAQAGRLLLVLGGAYLLRALTEVGQVAPAVGAAAGLVYGLVWLGLAERSGKAGDTAGATWHGLGAAAIIFPLLWETSSRFGSIPLPVAAAGIALCTLAAFAIAARRAVPTLAVVFGGAAGVSGIALMLPHAAAAQPVMLALTVLSFGAMILGRHRGLIGAMWISAAAVDVAAGLLLEGALRDVGATPAEAIVLLALLAAGCIALIAWDALRQRRPLDGFDLTQTAAVLLAGFGAALLLAHQKGAHEGLLGGAAVVVAIGLYVLAFTVLGRERRHAFLYLTSIALVLVLAASASLLAHPVVTWTVLAVATAVTAHRFDRITLGVHAGMYALAATLASGVLAHASDAWTTLTGTLPTDLDPWLAVAALAIVGLVRVHRPDGRAAAAARGTRAVVLVTFVAIAGGLLLRAVTVLLPLDAAAPGGAGWLAAARTVVLAGLTIGCARLGRTADRGVLLRLVPVLLGTGAVKLLFEDLVLGRPLSLALSFAAFGTVLILATRRGRGARPA